jgi:hypothetical protein
MTLRKDVTVLATLVALICDMPLKCEILHMVYFSPAPHAEPQAAGFSSTGLSPAPHAEPHAAGFSSAGLSPAPHAEPHAAGFSSAGLSPAPQAAPQAAGFSLCFNIPCALCAKPKSILFIRIEYLKIIHNGHFLFVTAAKLLHFIQLTKS